VTHLETHVPLEDHPAKMHGSLSEVRILALLLDRFQGVRSPESQVERLVGPFHLPATRTAKSFWPSSMIPESDGCRLTLLKPESISKDSYSSSE